MIDNISTVVVSGCPICGDNADSNHHIKPIAAGGEDRPSNRVWLCKRCHNIVEMIYDETGVEYCPTLIYHIRREFGLGKSVRVSATRPKYNHQKHKKLFHFREDKVEGFVFPETGICARCGNEFDRTRSNTAICKKCIKRKTPVVVVLFAKENLKAIKDLRSKWNTWQYGSNV